MRRPGCQRPTWRPSGLTDVRGCEHDHSELWLLIVFDLCGFGDALHASVRPVDFSMRSFFNRIYCFDRITKRAVQIPGGMSGTGVPPNRRSDTLRHGWFWMAPVCITVLVWQT